MDVRKEFNKLLSSEDVDDEVTGDIEYDGGYNKKFGTTYSRRTIAMDTARWELSCALLTNDWKRVRNALIALGATNEQTKKGRRGDSL